MFKVKAISKTVALFHANCCMICAMSVNTFAAEIVKSGGSGTTPVNLTTTNDGLGGTDTDGDNLLKLK